MRSSTAEVHRVVAVVVNDLRADTISHLRLANVDRVAFGGAWTTRAAPYHGEGSLGAAVRDFALRMRDESGLTGSQFGGEAGSALRAAQTALAMQRSGLVALEWADASRAITDHGYASTQYHEAARAIDRAFGLLAALLNVRSDPTTLLIVATDRQRDRDGETTIVTRGDRELLLFQGRGVSSGPLEGASVNSVLPMTRWWLGQADAPHDPAIAAVVRAPSKTSATELAELRR